MRPRTPSLLTLLILVLTALAPPAAARGSGWQWPVDGPVVTQYRNGDDPYAGGQHRGIDVAAPAGTPVLAASGGTVRFAGALGSAGLTVSIRTADGGHDTSFLHLGSIEVREGDRVDAGTRIGSVGTTGRRSLPEPHLHFGVRDAGDRFAYRDPLTFLPPPAVAPRVPAPRVARAPLPVPPLATPPAAPAPMVPLATPPAAPAPLVPLAPPAAPAASPSPAAAPSPSLVPTPGPAAAPAPLPVPPPVPTPGPSAAPMPSAGPVAALPPPPTPGPARAASSRDRGSARNAAPAPPRGRSFPLTTTAAPEPGSAPPIRSRRTSPAAAARGGPTQDGHGLDLGWLAACAGLVAVAALLTRPRGPAESLRRGTRLAGATRTRTRAAAAAEGADSIATWPTTSPRRSTT